MEITKMSHIKLWFLFAILNSIYLLEINSCSYNEINQNDFQRKSKLIFVHVLFRHGDRSPTQQSPGDPYGIECWPDGWGQLTSLGKQQHYILGKWLRSRYDGFLSQKYNPDDIYVQSSDVDRTLMSAQSNLAGLYTPQSSGYQIWKRYFPWQPIPVHTQPTSTDYLIAGVPASCSSYQKAYTEYLQSSEMQIKQEKAKPFFDLISAKIGVTVDNLMNLTMIRDSWLCETVHNLAIPKWATTLYPNNKDFDKAALAFYYTFSGTPYLAKYFSGFLLKDILDRLTSKVEKTLTPDRKFWMYSSHDANVFGFLLSLGIGDNQFAGYAATVVVELRSYKNDNYVQIFYKNSQNDVNPKPIYIPGCGIACPLRKMYEIYDNILPKNAFDIECQIDE